MTRANRRALVIRYRNCAKTINYGISLSLYLGYRGFFFSWEVSMSSKLKGTKIYVRSFLSCGFWALGTVEPRVPPTKQWSRYEIEIGTRDLMYDYFYHLVWLIFHIPLEMFLSPNKLNIIENYIIRCPIKSSVSSQRAIIQHTDLQLHYRDRATKYIARNVNLPYTRVYTDWIDSKTLLLW